MRSLNVCRLQRNPAEDLQHQDTYIIEQILRNQPVTHLAEFPLELKRPVF